MNTGAHPRPAPDRPHSRGPGLLGRLGPGLVAPLVFLLIGVLFAAHLIVLDEMPAGMALGFSVLDWLPWVVLAPAVLWFGRRFELGAATWKRHTLLHLSACIAVVVLLEWQARLIMRSGLFGPPPRAGWGERRQDHPGPPVPRQGEALQAPDAAAPQPQPPPGERHRLGGPGNGGSVLRTPRARMSIPLYWVLVAVAHALVHHQRSVERERRALSAEARLAEARLASLQAQLNPHFLFNTLNTLSQFVHEDPAASERMIDGLSRLLRASLAASSRRFLPLSEELALLDAYLEIQTARFPDRLSVVRRLDPEALSLPVPTLLLQPLVENAVLHGVAARSSPGVVEICVRRRADGGLSVRIADTGDGSGRGHGGEPLSPEREGVGLRNTRERLAALYGGAASFRLLRDELGGVASLLELPPGETYS